jgi:hypothetical protein
MTKNKDYRKQLRSQYRSLEEHLEKIAEEKQQPVEAQDLGLDCTLGKDGRKLPSTDRKVRKEA